MWLVGIITTPRLPQTFFIASCNEIVPSIHKPCGAGVPFRRWYGLSGCRLHVFSHEQLPIRQLTCGSASPPSHSQHLASMALRNDFGSALARSSGVNLVMLMPASLRRCSAARLPSNNANFRSSVIRAIYFAPSVCCPTYFSV